MPRNLLVPDLLTESIEKPPDPIEVDGPRAASDRS